MPIANLFNRPGQDVVVEALAKTYRSGDQTYAALNGVTCRLAKGEVTVVQGPSGCGKSTLLNMLGGIDRPDSGSLQVGDRRLTENMRDAALAKYRLHDIGFVFQAFNLVPGLTAIDNLQLPLTVMGIPHGDRIARGEALLDLVEMRQKARKRPDELSGGEQQRVATALALVNDPVLIIADEPTGNLDSRNAMKVADLLCSLAHDFGKTVIIATHDPAVAARGDVVFHMRDGVMTDEDTALQAAYAQQRTPWDSKEQL